MLSALLALPSALLAQTNLVSSPSVAENYLFAAANRDRIAVGLPVLQRDALLDQAAATHAREMARHEDISHGFPGEPGLVTRAARAGVRFSLISENVGQSDDSADIHNMWMLSAGHRENLLDPEVSTIGISVIVRDGELYAVEDFAGPPQFNSVKPQKPSVVSVLIRPTRSIATRMVATQNVGGQTFTSKKELSSTGAHRGDTPSLSPGQ